jgi:macrodomain Ter protein organizer (MatP/YcbG family)
LKARITITVDRDVFERIRGLSRRHGIAVSELVEKLFSEVANKAEIIEDQSNIAVVLRDSVIPVRKRHGG